MGDGEGGMFQEDSIETCILSRVKQITSPGWMHETRARAWCTGKTQRDWVEREVGGGIGMGNTCKSMADSCQCMTKNFCIIQKFMWNHRPTIARAIFGAGGEKIRKHDSPRLQTILQSYSKQNSLHLVQKQTCKWMEQYRKPRNKPIHLRSINPQWRKQE